MKSKEVPGGSSAPSACSCASTTRTCSRCGSTRATVTSRSVRTSPERSSPSSSRSRAYSGRTSRTCCGAVTRSRHSPTNSFRSISVSLVVRTNEDECRPISRWPQPCGATLSTSPSALLYLLNAMKKRVNSRSKQLRMVCSSSTI